MRDVVPCIVDSWSVGQDGLEDGPADFLAAAAAPGPTLAQQQHLGYEDYYSRYNRVLQV